MSTQRPQAVPTTQVSNELVAVTEWRFAPGAETGWHRHSMDYVVVPMTNGTLLLETKDGNHEAELVAGRSYSRGAGVEHNVVNASQHEVAFVEIEIR
jgi:beta-alanine degradation protein BauB